MWQKCISRSRSETRQVQGAWTLGTTNPASDNCKSASTVQRQFQWQQKHTPLCTLSAHLFWEDCNNKYRHSLSPKTLANDHSWGRLTPKLNQTSILELTRFQRLPCEIAHQRSRLHNPTPTVLPMQRVLFLFPFPERSMGEGNFLKTKSSFPHS